MYVCIYALRMRAHMHAHMHTHMYVLYKINKINHAYSISMHLLHTLIQGEQADHEGKLDLTV